MLVLPRTSAIINLRLDGDGTDMAPDAVMLGYLDPLNIPGEFVMLVAKQESAMADFGDHRPYDLGPLLTYDATTSTTEQGER
jgi:hypothetical protein